MNFEIDLRKSVNENAATYFDKSKKLKSKIEGVEETISKQNELLIKATLKKEKETFKKEEETSALQRKKEWFEKFRWFYTSKGTLCIGGRDASSNEVIIKKYTDKEDLVFHTDMAGSPFFALKLDKKKATKEEINEVAIMTACYSRAWKKGLSSSNVFYVNPDQVSKEANAGESLSKGSFMIRGKTNYAENKMELAISVEKTGRVIVGTKESIKGKKAIIIPGNEKSSDIAKKIKKSFKIGLLDDFVKVIPAGGCKLKEYL